MIDGFKNREVVQERYKSALNDLTQAERNEYLRDGQITVENTDVFVRREVEEKMTGRHESRKNDLEDLLDAEYYSNSCTCDGVPVTHYIHWVYGFVSLTRFSDNTIHVWCSDDKYMKDLWRDLYHKYETEMLQDVIRVDLNKKKSEDWKIELIKQQLNS